ncbi:MAG: methyltransferase domain-containing protein [Balneolaceae bacterium]|nr:methyltransferase domain-containing protein [Balneolaceae bacterium]MCH8549671.1 methyltransferase domain-containing protein [Balneolaceae bacterium]
MEPRLQRRVQRYGWDKAAEFYDDSWKAQLKPAQDRLMEMIHIKPGESVLETACGTGLVTARIAEAVGPDGQVTATDLSQGMIDLAKENLKSTNGTIELLRMDAENLELKESSFDAAICALGLMYVPDPLKSLNEMHRVLKPGGRVGVAIWGERKNCGWAEIFPIVDQFVASEVCPMFFQLGSGNTLKTSMKISDFRDIEVVRFHHKLIFKNKEHAIMAAFSGGPVALAYRKFDDETREKAHREYLNSISEFRKGNGYEIPGEFVVGIGSKLN